MKALLPTPTEQLYSSERVIGSVSVVTILTFRSERSVIDAKYRPKYKINRQLPSSSTITKKIIFVNKIPSKTTVSLLIQKSSMITLQITLTHLLSMPNINGFKKNKTELPPHIKHIKRIYQVSHR
jgi:hypothetical protein